MFRATVAAAFAAAALTLGMTPDVSATVVYDSSLTDPPGVFYGTGNSGTNHDWTVDNEADGIQLGLQALERFIGPYVPDPGTATYHVPTGPTSVPTETGADWGIAFSINIGTALAFSDVAASWCLTDVGQGTFGCFDPLLIPDNNTSGSVVQNSEALSFASVAAAFGDPGFNLNANDVYDFTLSLFTASRCINEQCVIPQELGSVSAEVIAGDGVSVPEPAAATIFGTGLLLFLAVEFYRRRRNQHSFLGPFWRQ